MCQLDQAAVDFVFVEGDGFLIVVFTISVLDGEIAPAGNTDWVSRANLEIEHLFTGDVVRPAGADGYRLFDRIRDDDPELWGFLTGADVDRLGLARDHPDVPTTSSACRHLGYTRTGRRIVRASSP